MALQIFDYSFDYSKAPLHAPDYEGLRNLIPNVAAGYKMSRLPEEQMQAEKKARLENALKEVDVEFARPKAQQELATGSEDLETKRLANAIAREYGIPEKEAEIALKQAQAEKALREAKNPTSNKQGHARNIEDLNALMNDPNVPQEYKDLALALFKNDIAKGETLVDTRKANLQWMPWKNLPKDDQAKITGQYAAQGINPQDALELWNNKITPEAIVDYKRQNPGVNNREAVQGIVSQMRGINPSGMPEQNASEQISPGNENPPMQMPAQEQSYQMPQSPMISSVDTRTVPVQPSMTAGDRSVFNQTKGALAEEEYIQPIITEAMKPYAKKYLGYSPKQFWDTTKKDAESVDKMAKFYAARALQPEIAGIRARMSGGSNAAQALHDIQVEALNKINVMDWRVSPEAYEKAQNYISEWMRGMTDARLNAMSGQINPEQMQTAIRNSSDKKNTVTRTVNGKRYEIPEHLVKQFDEDHK